MPIAGGSWFVWLVREVDVKLVVKLVVKQEKLVSWVIFLTGNFLKQVAAKGLILSEAYSGGFFVCTPSTKCRGYLGC